MAKDSAKQSSAKDGSVSVAAGDNAVINVTNGGVPQADQKPGGWPPAVKGTIVVALIAALATVGGALINRDGTLESARQKPTAPSPPAPVAEPAPAQPKPKKAAGGGAKAAPAPAVTNTNTVTQNPTIIFNVPPAAAPATPPPDPCAPHRIWNCHLFNNCMRTTDHNACNGMRNAASDAGCYKGAWDCDE